MSKTRKADWRPSSVHPLAARYPMISDVEMADLAEDIRESGQRYPIIVDGDVLIDGRNRLKACEIAEVEPRFEDFAWPNGKEGKEDAIIAEITRLNLKRRHQNAGQRAILYALAYPTPRPGKRTDLLGNSTGETVDKGDLSRARLIVNEAHDLVDQVIAGAMYFKAAFEEADKRRKAAEVAAAQMTRLQAEAPDLHAIVLEEKGLTAAQGIASLEQRVKEEDEKRSEQERKAQAEAVRLREECEQRTAMIQGALTVFNPRGNDPRAYAERLMSEIDIELWPLVARSESSIECWDAVSKTIAAMVAIRKEKLQ